MINNIPFHFHFALRIYTSIFYCFHFSFLFDLELCFCYNHLSYPLWCVYSLDWYRGPSWSWYYLCNQYLSPLKLWVRIPLRSVVLDTTLCDKVWQWLTPGRWPVYVCVCVNLSVRPQTFVMHAHLSQCTWYTKIHVYCIHENVSIYYLYLVKGFTRFVDSFFIDGRSSDLSPIRFKPRLWIWHFSTYNMQKYIYMLEQWLVWIRIRSRGYEVRPFLAKR